MKTDIRPKPVGKQNRPVAEVQCIRVYKNEEYLQIT